MGQAQKSGSTYCENHSSSSTRNTQSHIRHPTRVWRYQQHSRPLTISHTIPVVTKRNAIESLHLNASLLFLVDAAHAGRGALLLKLVAKVQGRGTMDLFLKDGLVLDSLEFGFQAVMARSNAEAVAATARFGWVVGEVLEFVQLFAPVASIVSMRYVYNYRVDAWRWLCET